MSMRIDALEASSRDVDQQSLQFLQPEPSLNRDDQRIRQKMSGATGPTPSAIYGDGESVEDYEMGSINNPGVSVYPLRNSSDLSTYKSIRSNKPLVDKTSLFEKSLHPFKFDSRRFTIRRLSGWRGSVLVDICLVTAVLVINFIVTIWASTSHNGDGAIGTISEGDCSKMKKANTWIHLAINVLGTMLLSASNYCMQCLSAPTRTEVDRAHSKGVWLDIGIPSVRNLRRIGWNRVALWWLLGLSSLPLHLMYNSAVFSTLSANDYQVAVVTESFLEGAPFNSSLAPSRHLDSMFRWFDGRPNAFPHLEMRKDINSLQKLENADCMRAYSNKYVADRRNVLAVTESSLSFPTNGSLLTYSLRTAAGGIYPDPRVWLCRFIEVEKGSTWVVKECDVDSAIRQSSDWTIEDYPIQYCLSERTEAHCKLQYSLTIMIVVIICNATKAVCMIALLLSQKEETLVTLGDAVSSFLEMPDSTTVACCTFDRDDFRRLPPGTATAPRPWRSKRHLWFNSCSLKRWVTCIGLCVVTLGASTGLLFIGIRGLQPKSKKTIAFLWRQGFGAVDSGAAFTTGPSSSSAADILSNILLANLPQLILSFLYLMYNGLYTCMLLTDEWSGFALQAKPLRVTSFKGHQRTTRWLQLPYSYAIPLSVASGAMHWFISQSIFLARITIYDENGNEDTGHSLSSCGYSPIAIIFTLILGTLMVLVVLINGFRRYHPGIPLASSCSAAISAACHPPPEDVDAAFLPVKWGAIPTKDGDVGHCTFTSQTVVPPVEGELYAGMEKGDTRSSLELTNDAVSWRPGLWKRRKVWSE